MTTTTKKKKCTAKNSKLKNNNVVHNFFTVRDKKIKAKNMIFLKCIKEALLNIAAQSQKILALVVTG
jgi:hypothetical protein